ncbi:hypothetical protein CCP4SC76_7860010 [Gammaproteobacteria bacterium]
MNLILTPQNLSFLFGALLLLIGMIGGNFEIGGIRIPVVPTRIRVHAAMAGFTFIGFALWQPSRHDDTHTAMGSLEWDMDRLGADYASFPLDNIPEHCRDACALDSKCLAWTYVKPNTIRGPKPVCYLKNAVPPPQNNGCCVSGVRRVP